LIFTLFLLNLLSLAHFLSESFAGQVVFVLGVKKQKRKIYNNRVLVLNAIITTHEMGWAYNVVDPNAQSNESDVIGVGIFFTILSLTVVSIRIYVRGWIVKAISLDDWIIVLAWVSFSKIS
jgi:hypothetical protein